MRWVVVEGRGASCWGEISSPKRSKLTQRDKAHPSTHHLIICSSYCTCRRRSDGSTRNLAKPMPTLLVHHQYSMTLPAQISMRRIHATSCCPNVLHSIGNERNGSFTRVLCAGYTQLRISNVCKETIISLWRGKALAYSTKDYCLEGCTVRKSSS
jgi:hypothetical protein